MIEIGAQGFLPGFSEGLVGAKVPSERTIPIDFPVDYELKELAGRHALFHVTIKELKVREKPALDDEFAKDIGKESLKDLRDEVTESLQHKRREEVEKERRQIVLQNLIAANPFELPISMVRAEAERLVAHTASRLEAMVGKQIPFRNDELLAMRDESMASAEFMLRSTLLVEAVAKAEDLAVSEDELHNKIDTLVQESGQQGGRVRSLFAEESTRAALGSRMLEDKVIAWLEKEGREVAPSKALPAAEDADHDSKAEKTRGRKKP
jgi:trigger factor